jgi:hypothetical protein
VRQSQRDGIGNREARECSASRAVAVVTGDCNRVDADGFDSAGLSARGADDERNTGGKSAGGSGSGEVDREIPGRQDWDCRKPGGENSRSGRTRVSTASCLLLQVVTAGAVTNCRRLLLGSLLLGSLLGSSSLLLRGFLGHGSNPSLVKGCQPLCRLNRAK